MIFLDIAFLLLFITVYQGASKLIDNGDTSFLYTKGFSAACIISGIFSVLADILRLMA